MATRYVVLQATGDTWGDQPLYVVAGEGEGTNAAQARSRVAETLPPDVVDAGVELIAVPERNWRTGRGTLKAETTRRIRSA
jgi:hypothetical protein